MAITTPHRLKANIQPDNTSPLNLVKRLEFQREGYSPAFQFVNGEWRDHERWAIITEMAQAEAPWPTEVLSRSNGDLAPAQTPLDP
ncbi:hypothetical protein ACH4TQ_06250 [Streptomyces sp. NPDC021218]|uniref:hypothetical protein n=1 Tax=unclassified Streptomyces TaxID=2593676 RepID=UPI0037B8BD04